MAVSSENDLPDDFARLKLPRTVADRLKWLLDRQDAGEVLTVDERHEAEALVNVTELLTLLRIEKQPPGS